MRGLACKLPDQKSLPIKGAAVVRCCQLPTFLKANAGGRPFWLPVGWGSNIMIEEPTAVPVSPVCHLPERTL